MIESSKYVANTFLQADITRRGVHHPRKMASEVYERDSAEILMLPLQVSLEPGPQIPVSPYTTLHSSALPPLEPRVSGCDEIFCIGPLRVHLYL